MSGSRQERATEIPSERLRKFRIQNRQTALDFWPLSDSGGLSGAELLKLADRQRASNAIPPIRDKKLGLTPGEFEEDQDMGSNSDDESVIGIGKRGEKIFSEKALIEFEQGEFEKKFIVTSDDGKREFVAPKDVIKNGDMLRLKNIGLYRKRVEALLSLCVRLGLNITNMKKMIEDDPGCLVSKFLAGEEALLLDPGKKLVHSKLGSRFYGEKGKPQLSDRARAGILLAGYKSSLGFYKRAFGGHR